MTECIKTLQRDGLLRNFWRKYLFAASTLLVMVLFFSCKQNVPSSGGASTEATRFDIVYELDGGKNNPENPTSYTTDKLPITLKAPTKEDKTDTKYAFVGWYTDKGHTRKIETIAKGTTGKLILYAKWNAIPIKNIAYKVIHFWQPAEGDTYVKHETETLYGKPDTDTVAVARTTYKGFHLSTVQHKNGKILQQKIKKDGSTIVKIYYDRNEITLTFDTDGGDAIEPKKGRYDATLLKPKNPTKEGHTFIDWNPQLPKKFPIENTKYKAQWVAEVLPQYKVEHWLQAIASSGKVYNANEHKAPNYEHKDTDTMRGKKDTQTQAAAKEYTGFEKPADSEIHQETIQADGSTVVRIYYVRKTIELTFKPNGGQLGGSTDDKKLTGKYGEKFSMTDPIRNNGDKFDKWEPELTKPLTFPADKTIYNAKWTTLNSIEITTLPTKRDYIVGEDFNPEGMVVKAKYSDSSNPVLIYNIDYTTNFASIKNNVGDNQTVTVNHVKDATKTVAFKVNIKAATLTYEVGDIIDSTDGSKHKAAGFSRSKSWDKYYVIIKREGPKYIGVRYLDNDYGSPRLGNSPEGTYRDATFLPSEKYLTTENIRAIVDNAAIVKASMDKIKTINNLSGYTNENCIAKDGYNFTNGNGDRLYSSSPGSFIPFAAREFN